VSSTSPATTTVAASDTFAIRFMTVSPRAPGAPSWPPGRWAGSRQEGARRGLPPLVPGVKKR